MPSWPRATLVRSSFDSPWACTWARSLSNSQRSSGGSADSSAKSTSAVIEFGYCLTNVTEREAMFRQMVNEFPDSPMGHFSLGKFLLEEKRFPEGVLALEKAVSI